MSELRFVDLSIPAAAYPQPNPLWDFGKKLGDAHSAYTRSADMPDDVHINPGDGEVPSILPYTVLDDYDREKSVRPLRAAVLENDRLRATFIPRLGGRLLSLYDKEAERELLHANPVFQPANLALRNAWFSGGVEWNISIIGHTPFTCSQLFTERLDGGIRGPVLRMYEYERVRRAVYQMDFYLPDGSRYLFARMSILNTTDHEIPMYWWTNMAVEERPDVRVIVPASKALHLSYESGLGFRPFPYLMDTDASYTTNLDRAMDFFFYIEPSQRKYIAAIDSTGQGFIQASTAALKGRKLFLWGMGDGGRHWQEYLSQKGRAYFEIQAGLGHSQMEYLHMPPRGRYEWMEAFGSVNVPPEKAQGLWDCAVEAVGEVLNKELPASWMEEELNGTRALSGERGAPVMRGSDWGALENERRRFSDEPLLPEWLNFDTENIGEEQRPWLSLLREKNFSVASADDPLTGYQVQPEWEELLASYCAEHPGNAAALFHLGVMRSYQGDIDGAKQSWERSMALEASARAIRGLALCEYRYGDRERALSLYPQACALMPAERALAVEFGDLCIQQGRYGLFLETLDKMVPTVCKHPRVRLLAAKCLIETGRLKEGEAILLSGGEVADIREGEIMTTELWFRIREKELAAREGVPESKELAERVRCEYTPPAAIDFRMS